MEKGNGKVGRYATEAKTQSRAAAESAGRGGRSAGAEQRPLDISTDELAEARKETGMLKAAQAEAEDRGRLWRLPSHRQPDYRN